VRQIETKSYAVHAFGDHVHVRGDAEQTVRMPADAIFRSLLSRPTARARDLLNIATGIYAVDRITKRKAQAGNDLGVRSLSVCFAVQDLPFWQGPEVGEALTELLCFLTDDNWSVTFQSETIAPPALGRQSRLEFPWARKPRRIALYSGGLDSAAGLANRVTSGVDDYLLVTVGHHSGLRHRCSHQVQRLSQLTNTHQQLHTALVVHLKGGASKRMSHQEPSQRSRAFLFCAAAAVVAQSCEVEQIEVFENGVGAINLPLMAGMLTGGLATRGAHPSFLRLMSQIATAVAERRLVYSLPFAEKTKAEMLAPLLARGLQEWAASSRSCVHTSLRVRGATHCGQCPGCIERRQAFFAAGMTEQVEGQYGLDLAQDGPLLAENADYLRCFLDNAAAWLNEDSQVHRRLHWHLTATDVPIEEHAGIADRQRRHAREVLAAFGHLTVRRESRVPMPRRTRPSLFSEASP
jgi:7-cyano-7-deazaguanine synthase in queuosine biosynthesis